MAKKGDLVRQQYEALPYPARDPADEAKRLVVGSPSHLLEIEHYVFAGRRVSALNALIAGGGTGDGAIMLAQQLADRGDGGQVLYVDLSSASLAIAKARADARGLDNIRFKQYSLLDVAGLDAGPFDYIDCCGVLHHLPEPEAGLQVLGEVLSDDGGMGLMVYGSYGRTGVYAMQQAFARLFPHDLSPAKRLAGAKNIVANLPETNWLKRNPFLGDHLQGEDAGFYDLLLHSQDRAYTVSEISTLVATADLRLSGFIEPARYDPTLYMPEGEARKRALKLPWLQQCALAEELASNLKTHVFYVVRSDNDKGGAADHANSQNVPVLREMSADVLAKAVARQPIIKANFDGIPYRQELPKSAAKIIALCDGKTSIRQIQKATGISQAAFKRDFQAVYAALQPLNLMLLAGRD